MEPWHNPSYFGLKTLNDKCVGVFFPAPLPRKIHEESFKCAKYLRAILVITYLFFYGYDCSDSTLTNMNEWIHEETRVMCYITHQKGKVLLRYKKKTVFQAHYSVVPGICSVGWNMNHCISVKGKKSQLFHKDGVWFLSVPTAVCFDCQSVTQQSSTAFSCKTAAFIRTHWLVMKSRNICCTCLH